MKYGRVDKTGSRALKQFGPAIVFTIKFLNFRTPENFVVIFLKIKQKRPNLRLFHQKDANVLANSEDPDLIWVCSVCPDLSF